MQLQKIATQPGAVHPIRSHLCVSGRTPMVYSLTRRHLKKTPFNCPTRR